jgi:hypothetical protein
MTVFRGLLLPNSRLYSLTTFVKSSPRASCRLLTPTRMLLPGRFWFPVPFGLNLLLPSGEQVVRRDVAERLGGLLFSAVGPVFLHAFGMRLAAWLPRSDLDTGSK